MLEALWAEFESKTSPCENGKHRMYGDTLIRCKPVEPNILRIAKIISFNPIGMYKTAKFLADLLDRHGVILQGIAMPCVVGPSVTKNNTFYIGMDQDRLIRFYEKFGCKVVEEDGKFHLTREPNQ